MWYYDYNFNGNTDTTNGYWGWSGDPLHTTHKQYAKSCGYTSLNYVANKFSPGEEDALGISTAIGGRFVDLDHLKAVIKGFIDHDIPILISIENGGHYNTLMGYWDLGDSFYIYTADPLDGYGRAFFNKPMRWRKILVNSNALPEDTGFFNGLMVYGHSGGCRGFDDWARDIDSRFDSCILCDCSD